MKSKGISPVIATVLLITISVGATASAFVFMGELQGEFKEKSEERLSGEKQETQSDINLETAYNSTENYTIINVRNTGTITMPVEENDEKRWNLYIDGQPVNGDATSWKYIDSSKEDSSQVLLDPESTLTINTTRNFPLQGEQIELRLVAPYKNTDTYVCYSSGGSSC